MKEKNSFNFIESQFAKIGEQKCVLSNIYKATKNKNQNGIEVGDKASNK